MVDEKAVCGAHPLFCQKLDEICEENKKLRENTYGKGPDGTGGIYGELKKKVSYKVLSLLLGAVLMVISFFAGFGINHENRLSKYEERTDTNIKTVATLCNDMDVMKKQTVVDVRSILDAIKELKDKP